MNEECTKTNIINKESLTENALDAFRIKYGLVIENNKRIYLTNLKEKLPLLENCVPYSFKYEDIEIFECTWNKMTIRILETLDKINSKTKDELLSLEYGRSKAPVFSETKRVNFEKFKDVYLNVNHTAVHSMMSIQLLLQAYNVDLDKAEFYIRKHTIVEPKEVRDFVLNQTKNEFKQMLIFNGYKEERADVYLKNFDAINKLLVKISPSFDNFFLFDDLNYFLSYKGRVVENAKNEYGSNSKSAINIKKTLDKYEEFFRYRDFYKKFSGKRFSTGFSLYIEKQTLELMDRYKTDVITINKLYARISILKGQVLKALGEFNDPIYFFLLVEAVLNKDFYFSYPYISRTYKEEFTSEEIIKDHIYKFDELKVDEIINFVDNMQLKKLSNMVQLLNEIAPRFVLVDCDKLVSKEKFLSECTEIDLENINMEISFYINSFGKIDSNEFVGYSSLPKIKYEWNKYLLLGITRTFLTQHFIVKDLSGTYKNTNYTIDKSDNWQ